MTAKDNVERLPVSVGYKLWTMTFPHDTTNPMPDPKLNTIRDVETAVDSANHTESLRTLKWLPEVFEREVRVLPQS